MALPDALQRVAETVWELPASYKEGMRVPARIYGTEKLVRQMDDAVYDQITNVATLPGIVKYALCMPDGHFGYGFPIGGVAAMDTEEGGVISPGGIGFDINCGMRLIKTDLTYDEVQPRLKELVDKLFAAVPAGVGSTGFLKLSRQEFRTVLEPGRPVVRAERLRVERGPRSDGRFRLHARGRRVEGKRKGHRPRL